MPDIVNFVFFSEIIKLPVVRAVDNRKLGRIVDLVASTGQVYPRITGLLVSCKGVEGPVYIPWPKVRRTVSNRSLIVDYTPGTDDVPARGTENEILLKKTFLDKQIISISGNKVVRVNDLHLLIDNTSKENPNLWLVHIDIGIKGLLRRLGWERFVNAIFFWVMSRDIRDKFVPWKYVQPTEMTNVYGSLHLKIDASKLSEVHPADIADILEDLGTEERTALLESLDTATAAATIQEIPMKLRVSVAESLDRLKLANIINEMHIDEAVDLLDEISPDRRNAVMAVLSPEKAAEIRDLSKLSMYSVGSIMNTDFITIRDTQTVHEAYLTLKAESLKTELIYYIYVVDEKEHLKGIVTIRQLLTANPAFPVSEIMAENIIAVEIDTNIKRVAQIFYKYNFFALPVIDDEKRVRGIITFRDALEKVFPEMTEESGG